MACKKYFTLKIAVLKNVYRKIWTSKNIFGGKRFLAENVAFSAAKNGA